MQKRQKDWLKYKFFKKSSHPAKSDINLSEKVTVLNQSTIERLSLIYQKVNSMKCVESNKFDNVYRKIWSIFV